MKNKFLSLYLSISCVVLIPVLSVVLMHDLNKPVAKNVSKTNMELQKEQLISTTVRIFTSNKIYGSGTIIKKENISSDDLYTYYILTAKHITSDRFVFGDLKVNSITGEISRETKQQNFNIVTFKEDGSIENTYEAEFLNETDDDYLDCGLLIFNSKNVYPVANLATNEILNNIKILTEVYAVGCALKHSPIITTGIISEFNEENNYILSTANIAFGSSGGGLFIKLEDKYYLIGILFQIEGYRDYLFSFLSRSCPIKSLDCFLIENGI